MTTSFDKTLNPVVVIDPSTGNAIDWSTISGGGKVTITQPATGATLTILDGKTFTVNKTLTLDGTDGTTMTFPTTSATVARTDAANTFTGNQTFSSLTANSIPYAGTAGLLSQNTTNLTWDNTNKHARIGSAVIGDWNEVVTGSLIIQNQALSLAVAGNFALYQDVSGATAVNAAGAQALSLKIGNSGIVSVTSSGMAVTGTLSTTAALTYGGVTLSNAVTGTGNMVLSASPTFTGTISSGAIVASGTISAGSNFFQGSGLISTANSGGYVNLAGSGTAPTIIQRTTTDVGLIVQGAASQAADLQQWNVNGGAALAKIDVNGKLTAVGASLSAAATFTAATAGVVLKQGNNGLCGTFVANGATPVTVNNTNVATTDAIIISLNTIGGTVGVQPHVSAITGGTSFQVTCTAVDTSTYNYAIIKNAA